MDKKRMHHKENYIFCLGRYELKKCCSYVEQKQDSKNTSTFQLSSTEGLKWKPLHHRVFKSLVHNIIKKSTLIIQSHKRQVSILYRTWQKHCCKLLLSRHIIRFYMHQKTLFEKNFSCFSVFWMCIQYKLYLNIQI